MTLAGMGAMVFWGQALAPMFDFGLRGQIAMGTMLLGLPALAVLGLLRRGSWRETVALQPVPRPTVGLSVLLGGALWVFSIGLMETQSLLLPPPPEYLEIFRAIHAALKPSGPLDALVSVTVIAVAPGVLEEIVTRGILLPSLVRPWGRVGAVVGSAFLFAAMHLDPFRFLFTFTIGLVLGGVRLQTGSLWPPIVAHVALNTVTFLIAPLVDDPSQAYEPQPLLGVGALVVGAAASVPIVRALQRSVDSSQAPT